ncbi:hypothetical protein cypCar_00031652 [Cyprinus carpio]|nr:hypothetical protein cypCar_00031652 [Cyprinus carpio]
MRTYFDIMVDTAGFRGDAIYIIQTAKNQSDAQSFCRQYYTDLPTIHNSEENDQIAKILIPSNNFWIGLFLDSWEWSDKWSRFFRHWAAGPVVPEYQFMNQSMTWLDAQSYCRARFTDLAAVTTMNDVNRLVNTVTPGRSGSVWIGLHAVGVKRWVWSMGDISISQENMWHPGEPNGDGECVRSFNGSWYDESCSTVLPFVCFNDSAGYMITKTAVTWRDAQSYCRQHHTDLASIKPEQQNLIRHESSLWIGLFLDSWEWSNQWSHFFRHWAAGQPSLSSGSSNCTGMSLSDSGKYAPYSCDVRQPFICYGDDKLIKNQIVRLKFSCTGKCTLNDPSLQTAILNESDETA